MAKKASKTPTLQAFQVTYFLKSGKSTKNYSYNSTNRYLYVGAKSLLEAVQKVVDAGFTPHTIALLENYKIIV